MKPTSGRTKKKVATAPASLTIDIQWDEKQVALVKKLISHSSLEVMLRAYLQTILFWSPVGGAIKDMQITINQK
jgi:hypothetical protein